MSDPGQSAERRQPPTPIPLTVLTGFLGAGKTHCEQVVMVSVLANPEAEEP